MGDEATGVAAITASELLTGVYRADAANRARRQPDLLIAAMALALDWSLATLNVREFSRVPGLSLVKLSQS